jgi:hypothetical protein
MSNMKKAPPRTVRRATSTKPRAPKKPDARVSPLTIVTARIPDNPVKLNKAERALLDEALLQGERTRDAVDDALIEFGRWVLLHVFANDATAATDLRTSNPVFLELLRRAGGPTLGLSVRAIHLAVHVAARDRRITDPAWRSLTLTRKELLLPLGDDVQIRHAARHVARMGLSHRDTRAYVAQLLLQAGKVRQIRVTLPQFTARLRNLREGSAHGVLRRMVDLAKHASPEEREAVRVEVHALREMLDTLDRALDLGE